MPRKALVLEYDVIASGSKGNAVIIENILVECGVSYKRIRKHLYGVDYLLITHRHGDHVKKATYEKIRKEFPNITVISNSDVADHLGGDVDIVFDAHDPIEVPGYVFHAFPCIHDVPCHGFYWQWDNPDTGETLSIIYATDTKDFRWAPRDVEFDYLFLESNHDEKKLGKIRYNSRRIYGYDAYGNGMRHASTQICKGYYYMHRRDKDSKLIELHKSERFY